MKVLRLILVLILFAALQVGSAVAQQNVPLGENAALRYWSAFAEMQDSVITDQQAKELNAILDGTAPYDDLKYQDLAAKNKSAVETMARGTAIPNCDWGIDYALGPDAPGGLCPQGVDVGSTQCALRLSPLAEWRQGRRRAHAQAYTSHMMWQTAERFSPPS